MYVAEHIYKMIEIFKYPLMDFDFEKLNNIYYKENLNDIGGSFLYQITSRSFKWKY
jgi:hypothetical protein